MERKIDLTWIERALAQPDRLDTDATDAAICHAFKRIAEMEDRVLRVVYNTRTAPVRVISAFFDRRMKDTL
jgi:hypothetical protein